MKRCPIYTALTLVLFTAMPVFAGEKTQPVRTGTGLMTFDTVPGWGLDADGKSVLGAVLGTRDSVFAQTLHRVGRDFNRAADEDAFLRFRRFRGESDCHSRE